MNDRKGGQSVNERKGIAQRSMGAGLRALGALASSEAIDKLGVRKQVQQALFKTTKRSFKTATVAGRTFKAAQKLGKPARQQSVRQPELFDLTPDDEQVMLQEAVGAFAAERVSAAASQADAACSTPKELIDQAAELGIGALGIPEELGGVLSHGAAVTGVLVAEALAHGDLGLAYALLAPSAVATALGLWGTGQQQATYLPAFAGEHPPAAALAVLEPRPLFDPMHLHTTARLDGADWVLHGVKSLLARASECELFIVAAEREGAGPALFVLEAGTTGLSCEPEPAMGLRPAATGKLILQGVKAPQAALISDASAYPQCIARARIAWCALATGTAKAVLHYVIPYVNGRSAFGEPISHRQAVAFTVADIGIEADAMQLLTWRAAARADAGRSFLREAGLARRLAAAKAMKIGSDGVQLLGGHGYVKDHPVERWYRDLRAAGVMEGALLV